MQGNLPAPGWLVLLRFIRSFKDSSRDHV
uniref:Uncharacterized protein n=1 Tax=Anguilla anguilla TaxID=7936 RepID=A0A0E9UC78_ANGAN